MKKDQRIVDGLPSATVMQNEMNSPIRSQFLSFPEDHPSGQPEFDLKVKMFIVYSSRTLSLK